MVATTGMRKRPWKAFKKQQLDDLSFHVQSAVKSTGSSITATIAEKLNSVALPDTINISQMTLQSRAAH